MLQNGQYRPSKIVSLEPLEQPPPSSLANYGTTLHHRCKTPLTSFASQECALKCQHTRPWKACMIGTATRWPLLVKNHSSTKTWTLMRHGPHMAWMRGYLALQKTTTNAIYTMSPKQKDTVSQDPLTCSLNTARPLHIRQYSISVSSRKN